MRLGHGMSGVGYLLLALAVLLLLGLWESLQHRRNLARIPIRIHVNGTRGKSSVTRLLAAALNEAGIVTCAKTTGTLPRLILPDGREVPIFRPAGANVIEQVRIISAAAAHGAQALVVECMAVQPLLQSLSEFKLIRATHGVITNARADHLDVMGPDEEDVARALAGMIPPEGKLFTAEQRHLRLLHSAAEDRGARIVAVEAGAIAAISDADLNGFRYTEHADNVALALAVCADLGIDRETALRGMRKTRPDAGAMTAHVLDFFGRRIAFVNGFAANDPESTERVWRMSLDLHPDVQRRVALFNLRDDRPDRSLQLGRACAAWPSADRYVLTGGGTYLFARAAAAAGLDPGRLIFAEDRRVEEIFETVVGECGVHALVVGMGNMGGQGIELTTYFRNRAAPEEAA